MNEEQTKKTEDLAPVGRYRPKASFYHANAKGTGAAMRLELHPAHDDVDGSIWMTLANQLTVGDRRGPNPVFPRFDWDSRICVKLDFSDLCQFVQVFRGECESVGGEKGLIHVTAEHSTHIHLRHLLEPIACYSLEVYRSSRDGKSESSCRFAISPAEALGICLAIENSFGVISFGIPMVIPRDTTAYRREQRGGRNAVAA